MKRFRSFNNAVLNLLAVIYFRLRKTVLKRVTVVKFRVDNRGSDDTGCFRIKIRVDTTTELCPAFTYYTEPFR